jgi:hypothetical protein
MNKIFLFSVLYLLNFTISFAQGTMPNASAAGWIELINGKDFSEWLASEHKDTWSITEDGLYQGFGKRSHLYYKGDDLKDGYKNFEIDVQVKTYKLANSGIIFHTSYTDVGWPASGFEIQVNHSHIGEGDYIELKKFASLYGQRNVYKSFAKDDEFSNIKARVNGNRVEVWLNGLKTVDYAMPTPISGERALGKGTFCLQGHDILSQVQYKSFKVRRLPDNGLILPVKPIGAWYDSMRVYSGKQIPFIDLNPPSSLSAIQLTNILYKTGINSAIVVPPSMTKTFASAKNKPLFTGVRVNAVNQAKVIAGTSDYTIGVTTDYASLKTLVEGGKINILADKGRTINESNAVEILTIASNNNIAIEINHTLRYPSIETIKLGKQMGCKFTMGGLTPTTAWTKSNYILDAIKQAGLTYKDFYIPGW